MMRFLHIALKQSLELVRDPKAFGFLLAFPIVFMVLFSVAFSTDFEDTNQYSIVVINEDTGVMNLTGPNTTYSFGDEFVGILDSMNFTDSQGRNTTRVFSIAEDMTREEAEDAVKAGAFSALVVIPANFSEAMAGEIQSHVRSHFYDYNGTDPNTTAALGGLATLDALWFIFDENVTADIQVIGDPSKQSYFAAQSIIIGVFEGYKGAAKGISLNETEGFLDLLGIPLELNREKVLAGIVMETVGESDEFTAYDYLVPGMMIFGILMSGIAVTSTLAEEKESGRLSRLRLTQMTSGDMLLGTLVTYSITAVIQVIILFLVAMMMGYHASVSANIALGLFIAAMVGVATVALGLIIAAFVSSAQQAGSVGPIITVPISFLTGAFFPMPNPTLISDFYGKGQDFGVFDILPWKQGVLALQKVLTFGSDLSGVATELSLLVVQSVLLFLFSVFLYERYQLRKE